MSRVHRFFVWVAAVEAVLVVALAVAMTLSLSGIIHPRDPMKTVDDPDYSPGALAFCTGRGGLQGSSAPIPRPALVPRGQLVATRIASFQVAQPVQQTTTVVGRHAHGVFVVVDVIERYTGDSPSGLSASPLDYQLVDGSGELHCAIQHPTDLLNQVRYPNDVNVGSVWWIQLTPTHPEAKFSLVFDIDPALVQGSYLLAFDMPKTERAALDLGLS